MRTKTMVNRFSYDTPPKNFPKAIKTARGWVNPNNHRDVYVAIPNLNARYDTGGDNKADILKVYFGKTTAYAVAEALSVKVQFSEFVDVSAGASLVVNTVPGRSTLSVTGTVSDGETITLGTKVYTFQTTLTNVDGNVKIGATIEESVSNLIAAITLGSGAGTKYATLMTLHPTISAIAGTHVAATGTLTTTGQPLNGEAVTIGSKVYTFQDTLTNVDGNVKIGATQAASVTNLINAINLGAGVVGTDYATAMTINPSVTAANGTANTAVLTAKIAGGSGNAIATTETLTNGSFGAVTLTGGSSKLVATAKTSGTGGNSLATTETMTNGAFSSVTLSGGAVTTLYAAAQAKSALIVFNKQNDNTTNEVVPSGAANMSIATQTISGTITDYSSAVKASGTLTLTDVIVADETVVIDDKTYTFKATLTNTDGYVKLGADNSESLRNLVRAINLGSGAGSMYALATVVHPTVTAIQAGSNVVTITAKTGGTAGNSLATTETLTNGAFGAATLAGGVASIASNKILTSGVVGAITNASIA